MRLTGGGRKSKKRGWNYSGLRMVGAGVFEKGSSMKIRNVAAAVWLSVAMAALAGGRGLPIEPMEDMPLETKTPAMAARAIREGALKRGWIPETVDEGLIRCRLNNRGHVVVVDVPYTAHAFSIRYSSSVNLDYDPVTETIHRKYNQWVANLALDIQRAAFTLPPEPGYTPPVVVYQPPRAGQPTEDEWSYDADTRRGTVSLKVSEGMTPEEAKQWAREHIEAIVQEKNVALDAGGGAVYRCLDEHLQDGVLTVEFEAVE